MGINMNIGKQIRMYRLQKKVKQEELAAYFGVTIDDLFQISHKEQFERIENMLLNESRIKRENFDQAVAFLEGVIREEPNNDTRNSYESVINIPSSTSPDSSKSTLNHHQETSMIAVPFISTPKKRLKALILPVAEISIFKLSGSHIKPLVNDAFIPIIEY